jgi:heptosyltransferase-2
MRRLKLNRDCKYYKGDIPCKPHKQYGVHCDHCNYYKKINRHILIIKQGARGDVIRTTPLLRKLKANNPHAKITWLTNYPDVLSNSFVDCILAVSPENILWLQNRYFDWVINLDKDKCAICLTRKVKAKKKTGFIMDRYGNCMPVSKNKAECDKWLAGMWDDMSRRNVKHYQKEIFQMCDFQFRDEEYVVQELIVKGQEWDIDHSRCVVGLNTGTGKLWSSRQWPQEYWIELAKRLRKENMEVILLGGKLEDEQNKKICALTGARYYGFFSYTEFLDLVNQCALIVTCVTMCLHVAIGLKKKVALLNSTFNKNEFYLYGRGCIVEPDIECDCYYAANCPKNCMQFLSVDKVRNACMELLRTQKG